MKPLLALLSAVILMASARAADWPQFRGPAGSGVAAGQTPPLKFGPTDSVKWKVTVPPGSSSPVIVGDRIFLTAFENNKLFTIGYDRATGKELWRKEAETKGIEPYHKTEGSPAASTCAAEGDRVVSYFGSCGLICHDLAGTELWKFVMPKAETGFDFGTGVSPIIADGLVILTRDLKTDSKLYAIDLKTGSKVWETKREKFPTSWSTPAVWDKQIVLPGYGRMVGYDLKTGTETWTIVGMPAACCTTPIVVDGNLLFAGWAPGDEFKMPAFEEMIKGLDKDGDGALSKEEAKGSFIENFFDNNDTNKDGKITKDEWDANGKFMSIGQNSAFAVKPGGKGDITKSHVIWKSTNKKVLPYVPSAIAYEGHFYMVKDGGLVSAFEVKTGKEVYAEERVAAPGQYYASPIAANGHVYYIALNGDITIVKAGEMPAVAFRGKLNERTQATPAIVENTLYVRTAKHLYAFADAAPSK